LPLGQADEINELLRVGVLRFATAVQPAVLPNDIDRASTRVNAALLKHDAHFVGQSSVIFGGVEPKNSDVTRRCSPKSFAHFNRAGFPSAIWTENSSDLSGPSRKRDRINCDKIAIPHREMVDDQGGLTTVNTRKRRNVYSHVFDFSRRGGQQPSG
jgi:hypothetical protein